MELRLKITIRSHVNKTYWNLGKKERNGRQNAPKNTLPAKDGVPSLLNIYIYIYLPFGYLGIVSQISSTNFWSY